MSGIDISNLSYKELQALALRYRVPGNIKKQLLIEVLQAARCGNEQEVDKLLSDLRQTRKKRIRKGKPMKLTMSLASTPIHSPTYDMVDDYYAAQHRPSYQWIGAEEEIPNRQDDANRVPQYEEFRQFLLRRIQRDYQTYNTNHNDKVDPGDSGSIMDLRNDQGESMRFETNAQAGMRSSTVPVNSLGAVQSYSEQMAPHNAVFDYQIFQDTNDNGNASILLRRMLQAPVGADLGEIASPELGSSCKIWGADQYQSENNLLDNSDTLSANSDVNGNDDNNWPVGTEYYRFVNNVRDQLIFNQGNIAGNRTFHDQPSSGQFCNILTDDNPVQYQLLYANELNDVQQPNGQQQWETPGPFDNDVLNCQKHKNPGAGSTYYDGIGATNYAIPRPLETDSLNQQYPNEDCSAPSYSADQNGFDENTNSALAVPRSEVKFYQNLNGNNINADVYSTLQHPPRQINEPNCNYTLVRPAIHSTSCYATQGESQLSTPGFIPPMQHLLLSAHNQNFQVPPPAHNGYLDNLGCISGPSPDTQSPQIEEFNRPSILGHYQMVNRVNPIGESEQVYRGDRDVIRKPEIEGETDAQNKTMVGSTSTTRSDGSMNLEPFWPQRSVGKNTTNNCLENILNLNAYGYVDYAKIDQTSCIYCYSAPIVTQKLFSASSSCSQKKRFVAEFRQHTFSPYWLLYNDTTTGMQMSKHAKTVGKMKDSVAIRNDERTLTSTEEVTNVNVDLGIPQIQKINVSELLLEEQQLKAGITELVGEPGNRCHGKEMPSLNSNIRLNSKSDVSSADSNDEDETQNLLDLNMENTGKNGEL